MRNYGAEKKKVAKKIWSQGEKVEEKRIKILS